MYSKESFVVNGGLEPLKGIRIAGSIYKLDSLSNSSVEEAIEKKDGIKMGSRNNKFTIIITHPNGFVKEMWQPFIHELLAQLENLNIKKNIDKIITIDIRNQGDSALLNKGKFLDFPFKWKYNEDDILAVIKNLNLEKGNIIGIGNSIGAVNLLTAEATQEGTFTGIVGMDPSLFVPHKEHSTDIEEMFKSSGRRRSTWPDRETARKHFESRFFYQAWSPLVLEEYLNHGLRLVDENSSEVTLKCPPFEEMKTFIDDYEFQYIAFDKLSKVNCSTLILSGDGPLGITNGEQLTAVVNQIPSANYSIIPDSNHLLPFENPKDTAVESAKFIASIVAQQEIITTIPQKEKFKPKI